MWFFVLDWETLEINQIAPIVAQEELGGEMGLVKIHPKFDG